MKVIRNNVFETNSSSTHSISIYGKDWLHYDGFENNNQINVSCDEFGWGYDKLVYPLEKLRYIITAIQYYDNNDNINIEESIYFQWLSEMIKDNTGKELIFIKEDGYYPLGYIDHQSTDTLDDFWSEQEEEFKENMRDLIFNDKYTIIIDNDNH